MAALEFLDKVQAEPVGLHRAVAVAAVQVELMVRLGLVGVMAVHTVAVLVMAVAGLVA